GERALVRSYDPFVAAVDAAVSAVAGLGRGLPALFGHSMGGAVALSYALGRPERVARLVLSAPYLVDARPRPAWMTALAGAVAAVAPRLPVARLDAGGLSRDPRVGPAYTGDALVHSGPVPAATGHTLISSGARLLADAPRLRVPTLVLHGEADAIAGVEGSRALARGAPAGTVELLTFPDAFHELHNEPERTGVPQRFTAAVLGFVAAGRGPDGRRRGRRGPRGRDQAPTPPAPARRPGATAPPRARRGRWRSSGARSRRRRRRTRRPRSGPPSRARRAAPPACLRAPPRAGRATPGRWPPARAPTPRAARR